MGKSEKRTITFFCVSFLSGPGLVVFCGDLQDGAPSAMCYQYSLSDPDWV